MATNSSFSRSFLLANLRRAGMFIGVIGCVSLAATAAPIAVPNGNFSSGANAGSISGGLIGSSVSNQMIGQGPWVGSAYGVASLLAPPALTISGTGGYFNNCGYGQISGVAGSATGNLDNGGFFSQTLSNMYQANTTYTLTADLNASKVLNLAALNGQAVGIGLTNVSGGNTTSVINSTDAPQSLVTLQLLSGYEYELTVRYFSGSAAPNGQIGIKLFDTPTGLANDAVLSSVRFDNVSLDATTVTPEPASLALCGLAFAGAAATVRLRKRSTRNAA